MSDIIGNNEPLQKVICRSCEYLLPFAKCQAFPKGIPDKILFGENDHSKPLPGQGNRLVFKQAKDRPEWKKEG